MIVPGKLLPALVSRLIDPEIQIQPCGLDLTLRKIMAPTSAGVLDFDNSARKIASTKELPFIPPTMSDVPSASSTSMSIPKSAEPTIHLPPGVYLLDFNETVTVPLDKMATIFPRSSLMRNFATFVPGIVDAGYQGGLGAQLIVSNPFGITLHRNARLAQMVFMEMSGGNVETGYSGQYQGTGSLGREEKSSGE